VTTRYPPGRLLQRLEQLVGGLDRSRSSRHDHAVTSIGLADLVDDLGIFDADLRGRR
jgi:hypothetical protein